MTLLLSNTEVNDLLTMPEALTCLEAAYEDIALGKAIAGTRADNVGKIGRDDALYQLKTRTDDRQVSCFLNYRGLGVQFAALGHVVYNRAVELGIGRDLPSDWFTEDVCP